MSLSQALNQFAQNLGRYPAIIDRIVHHGRLLEFTGQSRRVSEALMFGRNTSAQPEK